MRRFGSEEVELVGKFRGNLDSVIKIETNQRQGNKMDTHPALTIKVVHQILSFPVFSSSRSTIPIFLVVKNAGPVVFEQHL